jgi:hypothetical protein
MKLARVIKNRDRDGGDERGQRRIRTELRQGPTQQDDRDRLTQRDDDEGPGHHDGARDDPRSAPTPAGGGVVGQSTEHHIADHREECDDTEDQTGRRRLLLIGNDRRDLHRDADDRRTQQSNEEDQLGENQRGDVLVADRLGGLFEPIVFVRILEAYTRMAIFGAHRALLLCRITVAGNKLRRAGGTR